MEWLLYIGVGAFILWLINNSNKPSQQATSGGLSPELKAALEKLQRVMQKCQEDHEHATLALVWLASSDGTISRQELRIIIGFCSGQGTQISKADLDSVERLNSGLNMQVTSGEKGALENLAVLKDKPIHYRAAFLGAVEAICAANRTINVAKKRMQQAARELVNS